MSALERRIAVIMCYGHESWEPNLHQYKVEIKVTYSWKPTDLGEHGG